MACLIGGLSFRGSCSHSNAEEGVGGMGLGWVGSFRFGCEEGGVESPEGVGVMWRGGIRVRCVFGVAGEPWIASSSD